MLQINPNEIIRNSKLINNSLETILNNLSYLKKTNNNTSNYQNILNIDKIVLREQKLLLEKDALNRSEIWCYYPIPCYNELYKYKTIWNLIMKAFCKLCVWINRFFYRIFYIGKASANNWVFDYLRGHSDETEKLRTIKNIQDREKEPKVEILRYVLKDAETAFKVDAWYLYIY